MIFLGEQPATHRFLEALSVGSIPLLIYPQRFGGKRIALPFEDVINWSPCLEILTSLDEVRKVLDEPQSKMLSRAFACNSIYNKYLSTPSKQFETLAKNIRDVL